MSTLALDHQWSRILKVNVFVVEVLKVNVFFVKVLKVNVFFVEVLTVNVFFVEVTGTEPYENKDDFSLIVTEFTSMSTTC